MGLFQKIKNLFTPNDKEPSYDSDLETFMNGGNLSPELRDQFDMEEYQNKIKRIAKKLPLEHQYKKALRLQRQVRDEEFSKDLRQTLATQKQYTDFEREELEQVLEKEKNNSLRLKIAKIKQENEKEEFGTGRAAELRKRHALSVEKMTGKKRHEFGAPRPSRPLEYDERGR